MRISQCALAALLCARCPAQSSDSGPVFDAVSVRAADATQNVKSSLQVSPGSLVMRSQTLRSCIQWAWDLQQFQISGPAWLGEIRFDILGRASSDANEAQLRLMLRRALADRFGLKVHTQSKMTRVYELVQAKGGAKLQESSSEGPPVFGKDSKRPALTAVRASMKDFVAQISGPLGRPVIDATGLVGRYDIRIDVTPFMADATGGKAEPGGDADIMSTILFVGMPQQLGLKLEAKDELVDVLIVDHAERTPTEN